MASPWRSSSSVPTGARVPCSRSPSGSSGSSPLTWAPRGLWPDLSRQPPTRPGILTGGVTTSSRVLRGMSSAASQRTVHGYTLQHAIGEGSFGTVWKALAPGDFPAAVKFISRARDDLIALPELKALDAVRTLNSPYIVKVF